MKRECDGGGLGWEGRARSQVKPGSVQGCPLVRYTTKNIKKNLFCKFTKDIKTYPRKTKLWMKMRH